VIERIQVEEGFLDGLDLTFVAGLNVVIGPRGSGKTSIIELGRELRKSLIPQRGNMLYPS